MRNSFYFKRERKKLEANVAKVTLFFLKKFLRLLNKKQLESNVTKTQKLKCRRNLKLQTAGKEKNSFKHVLKDTLMQISESPYMFVFMYKKYPENFAFLIRRILELFAREVYKFSKE